MGSRLSSPAAPYPRWRGRLLATVHGAFMAKPLPDEVPLHGGADPGDELVDGGLGERR